MKLFGWWSVTPGWLVRLGYPDPEETSIFPPWRIAWGAIWVPLLIIGAGLIALYGLAIGGPHKAKQFWEESIS